MLRETVIDFNKAEKIKGNIKNKSRVDFRKLSPETYGVEFEFVIYSLNDFLEGYFNINSLSEPNIDEIITNQYSGTYQDFIRRLEMMAYSGKTDKNELLNCLYYLYEMEYYLDKEQGLEDSSPIITNEEELYKKYKELTSTKFDSLYNSLSDYEKENIAENKNINVFYFIKWLGNNDFNYEVLSSLDIKSKINFIQDESLNFYGDMDRSDLVLETIYKLLPVSRKTIGDGSDAESSGNWAIGWDDVGRGGGNENRIVEIRSPVLKVGESYDDVKRVMSFIRNGVDEEALFSVGGDTSAHVHIGVGVYGKDFDTFDIIAINSLVDEKAIQYFEGKGRDFSRWATLGNELPKILSGEIGKDRNFSIEISEEDLLEKVNKLSQKFRGVNISETFYGRPTVEFRYLSSRAVYNPDQFIKWIEYFDLLVKTSRRKNRVFVKSEEIGIPSFYAFRTKDGVKFQSYSKEVGTEKSPEDLKANKKEGKRLNRVAAIKMVSAIYPEYNRSSPSEKSDYIEKLQKEFFKLPKSTQSLGLKALNPDLYI